MQVRGLMLFVSISQLGIMMNGTMIDNTVIGGPAFNSKQMAHGDIILKVNGVSATKENILDLLVGNDIPGSPVEVLVAKGSIKVVGSPFDIALL